MAENEDENWDASISAEQIEIAIEMVKEENPL